MGQARRVHKKVPRPKGSRQVREAQGRTEAGLGNLPQEPQRPAQARRGPGQANGEEQGRK